MERGDREEEGGRALRETLSGRAFCPVAKERQYVFT